MVFGMFFVRKREGLDAAAYAALNERMWEIVASGREYGLIGAGGGTSADGRGIAMAFFKTAEGMRAWKQQVDHAAAQQRGRDEFFLDYWGFNAEVTELYEFDVENGRRELPLDAEGWLPAGFDPPAFVTR